MTAQGKRNLKWPGLLGGAMPVLANALGVLQTVAKAVSVSVAATAEPIGFRVVILPSAQIVGRGWVMLLFAPNAKPWRGPRCRCANWPRKPMAKPSRA